MVELPIVLAADELSHNDTMELAKRAGKRVYAIKIHNLWDQIGPGVVQLLKDAGRTRVWVDLKLHDIPSAVKLRAAAVALSGADILTVHASGGIDMMRAAVEHGPSEVYAVTVLTSLLPKDVRTIYGRLRAEDVVMDFAKMAKEAGVHGIVCSPMEVAMLAGFARRSSLKLVVPGLRSPGVDAGDHKRTGTPVKAFEDGASIAVIGGQVTKDPHPVEALNRLEGEVGSFLKM